MTRGLSLCAALAFVSIASACLAAGVVVDGSGTDGAYSVGAAAIQTVNTTFGDDHLGNLRNSTGSELNSCTGVITGGTLYLMFFGNLQSNFTNLEVFIDSHAGGQPVLLPNNPDVDGNGLNRMAGLSFDADFQPDYYVTVSCGDTAGVFRLHGYFAELLSGGGGGAAYLGSTDAGLTGGGNALGIQFAIQNFNELGVINGCDPKPNRTADPDGIELGIPLSVLSPASSCVGVSAFINRPMHDFVSNQCLGPLPAPSCDLGDPALVSLASVPGNQFFSICQGATPSRRASWGTLKSHYR